MWEGMEREARVNGGGQLGSCLVFQARADGGEGSAHGGGENGENWMTSKAFRQIAKIL